MPRCSPPYLVIAALALAGCAAPSPPPLVVRARDLPEATPIVLRPGQQLVLEFDAGDIIPLDVSIDGDLAGTPPDAAPIPIRVKRRFWLKLDGTKQLLTSLDGVHFGRHSRPGSFGFHILATPESGTRAQIRIITPTP
jgi:hypothetical protein